MTKLTTTKTDNAMMQPAPAEMAPEAVRAMAQVQGQVIMARQFPRDTNQAYTTIMQSCTRMGLAESGMYSYSRGGSPITGPSIRLAEAMAQAWGNLDFGWAEVERADGGAVLEAWCWDLQTNVRKPVRFFVKHERHTRNKAPKALTDPRDIYELNANQAARRVRQCILAILPGDIVEDAVAKCRETVERGDGTPIADRVRKMVASFADLGVSAPMLEARLGHSLDVTAAGELADLIAVYRTLKDNPNRRGEFFDVKDSAKSRALQALEPAQVEPSSVTIESANEVQA